jgi:hypothetical protein
MPVSALMEHPSPPPRRSDAFEGTCPVPRPFWCYLRELNAQRLDTPSPVDSTKPWPAGGKGLGSARIADVSPVRSHPGTRAVEVYLITRRAGAGRLIDVVA